MRSVAYVMMMMKSLAISGALLSILSPLQDGNSTSAHPQQNSSEPSTSDIVVQGRLKNELDHFVDQMSARLYERQIPRWNGRICPKVLGLNSAHSAFLISRLTDTAHKLKIRVDRGKCSGNIVVVVTNDGSGFVQLLLKRYPQMFQDISSGVGRLPAMRATLLTVRPVRWIDVSSTRSANGGDFTGQGGFSGSRDQINYWHDASRLAVPTREDAILSLAIVDASKIHGVSWGQLADYLVMVALARPDMTTRYDATTILSLFDLNAGGNAPQGLTDADMTYLAALYRTNPNASQDQQRTQIKSSLSRYQPPN